MPRYWFALGMGILIAAVIAGGMIFVNSTCHEMEELVKASKEAIQLENKEDALKSLKEGEALWDKRQNYMEAVLDHEIIDRVNIGLAETITYLKYDQIALSAANCHKLLHTLKCMREGQRFSFYNLF